MFKKNYYLTMLALVSIFLLFAITPKSISSPSNNTDTTLSDWQRSISVYPLYDEEFATVEFKHSLHEIAVLQANMVTFVIPYYQDNLSALNIERGPDTPTDKALVDGIKYAQKIDLQVTLKPHIETKNGQWRANLRPLDRSVWFENYQEIIMHYARLAQEHDVEQMVLGSELVSMTMPTVDARNTERWQKLIQEVRSVYDGKLTYNADWGHNNEQHLIAFWDQLDYIGISAYYPLSGRTSVALENSWEIWHRNDIKLLQNRYDIPILFLEIGYRNIRGAPQAPWDFSVDGVRDDDIQTEAYQAFFSYWTRQSDIAGMHLWKWEVSARDGENTDYMIQGKEAESAVRQWFTALAESAGDLNDPASPPHFTAESTIRRTFGGWSRVSVDLENQKGEIEDAIVLVYVHKNSEELAEFIKTYRGQSFKPGENQRYNFTWRAEEGDYLIKIGVFDSDGLNYFWENNPTAFRVTNNEKERFIDTFIFWAWPIELSIIDF